MVTRTSTAFVTEATEHGRELARRHLDPGARHWLPIGGLIGLILWAMAGIPGLPGHSLLHQRGVIQPISMLAGGMVVGFILLKYRLLARENDREKSFRLPRLLDDSDAAASDLLQSCRRSNSILARRAGSLLELWLQSHSTVKLARALEEETEAFDLAQQSSFALPRVLVWAVPVLGFIGTVVGIGEAVGSFQTFLSEADNIDVLRDGLVKVTSGLGTAFDTTFLALIISLLIIFPLTLVDRAEQHLLTRIDRRLKQQILAVLPEEGASAQHGVDQETLRSILVSTLQEQLPNGMGRQIETAATRLSASMATSEQLLTEIGRLASFAEAAKQDLASLGETGRMATSLDRLDTTLTSLKGALMELSKPRRVVLVEESE